MPKQSPLLSSYLYEKLTFLLTWAWSKWVQHFLSVRLYGCRYVVNFSHFQLRLHAKSPILPQMFIKGLEEVLYLFEVIRNPRWLPCPSDWLRHFQLLQIYSIWSRQTYQKYSSSSPQEVMLLFRVIWYPTWLHQFLIGWDYVKDTYNK